MANQGAEADPRPPCSTALAMAAWARPRSRAVSRRWANPRPRRRPPVDHDRLNLGRPGGLGEAPIETAPERDRFHERDLPRDRSPAPPNTMRRDPPGWSKGRECERRRGASRDEHDQEVARPEPSRQLEREARRFDPLARPRIPPRFCKDVFPIRAAPPTI